MYMNINTSRLKKKTKNFLTNFLKIIVLVGICFVILYPQLERISISFMSSSDLYNSSIQYIPSSFSLRNYKVAMEYSNYWYSLLKTLVYVIAVSVLQVASAMLVGYGFARFKFKGRGFLFGCVIATLIIPVQSFILPLYNYFRKLQLLGTPIPVILLSIGSIGLKSGLYIYMFRQYFSGIPKELEESGKIDGAGTFRIFRSIILPSSVTITTTCFLFSFVWQWTDNYYISVFMPTNTYLANTISLIATKDMDDYLLSILTNTGVILLIFPIMIVFLIAQRFFVQGIETSGIVG